MERPDEAGARRNIRRFAWQLNRLLCQTNTESDPLALGHGQVVHVVVDEEKSSLAIAAAGAAPWTRIPGAFGRLLRQKCHHRRKLWPEFIVKLMQQFQFAERRMHLSVFAQRRLKVVGNLREIVGISRRMSFLERGELSLRVRAAVKHI